MMEALRSVRCTVGDLARVERWATWAERTANRAQEDKIVIPLTGEKKAP